MPLPLPLHFLPPPPPAPAHSILNSNLDSLTITLPCGADADSDLDLVHHVLYSNQHTFAYSSQPDALQFYSHSSSKSPESAASLFAIRAQSPFPQIAATASHSSSTNSDLHCSTATRSLTCASPSSGDEDMAATFAPSSPPDLSSSRSSTKSSSLQSSPFANDDFTNDPSHFEDISLAADTPTAKPRIKASIKPRPLVRPSLASTTTPPSSLSSPNLPSDLRNGAPRPRSFKGPISPRGNWQRGNSSPAMAPPTFALARRTPSPNKSSPLLLSPQSRARGMPPVKSYENSPMSLPRRGSWQHSKRKTAAELEQEYNDSDEELPEDAIVWNIPLTPRPVDGRSQSNSPERASAKPSPAPFTKPSRSKSWTEALGDLSEEVKALTAALESHADVSGETEAPQSSGPPTRPSLKNHHAKSMNLPIQRGHAMIDPLPVSKEKEKFLTRTRPSWLPPKCPKEEKKHLREWERMMSNYLAAEKRRAATQTKSKASMEKQSASAAQVWETEILTDWNRAMRSPRTREMWWQGIPASVRGQVWTKAIGNDLHLSFSSYFTALTRATTSETQITQENKENQPQSSEASASTEEPIPSEASKQTARMARSLNALDADIELTFPSLELFQPQMPLHKPLRNILKAYAAYRSDTGYVRGTCGIAALILFHLSPKGAAVSQSNGQVSAEQAQYVEDEAEAKAFIALSNLLNKQPALAFCLSDESAKRRFASHVQSILQLKLPRLAEHFLRLDLSVDDWLTPMVQSMFTSMIGPVEVARVWDVLVFEGDVSFVRVAIGLLTCLEGSLYGDAKEVSDVLGWKGWMARKGEGAGVGTGTVEDATEALMTAVRWAGRKVEEVDTTSRDSVVSV